MTREEIIEEIRMRTAEAEYIKNRFIAEPEDSYVSERIATAIHSTLANLLTWVEAHDKGEGA